MEIYSEELKQEIYNEEIKILMLLPHKNVDLSSSHE